VGADNDLNLSRREADLALRFTRPTSGNAVIKKLGEVGFSAYVSKKHFPQLAGMALNDFPWTGYDESLQHHPEARWLADRVDSHRLIATTTDIASLTALVQSGITAAVLPCMTGDVTPGLVRLTGEKPISFREIWLMSHPDARKARRILVFSQWLQTLVKSEKRQLLGHCTPSDPS